jgi:hypothetical protein
MHRWSRVASGALCLLFVSSSLGSEVRTYSFVDFRPAYDFSCGECSGPPHAVRGHVDGTFEVDLDFENGVGTLRTLNAQLSNVEGYFGPDMWLPIEWDEEFFNAPFLSDLYRPPYTGVLRRASYRPLGPATITEEHWAPYVGVPTSQIPLEVSYWLFLGVGFEPAPPDSWILYPDGSLGASFLIYFEGNVANFAYQIPIIDAVPSIAAASATLIPEPASLCTFVFTVAILAFRRYGCVKWGLDTSAQR